MKVYVHQPNITWKSGRYELNVKKNVVRILNLTYFYDLFLQLENNQNTKRQCSKQIRI